MLYRKSPPDQLRVDKDNKPARLLQPSAPAPSHGWSALNAGRKWLPGLVLTLLLTALAGRLGKGQQNQSPIITPPAFRISAFVDFAASAGSTSSLGFAFPLAEKLVFGGLSESSQALTAFEENPLFLYAADSMPEFRNRPRRSSRWLRRVIFLKPSVFVVDDEFFTPGPPGQPTWRLYSDHAPEVAGRKIRFKEGPGTLFCETLFPMESSSRVQRQPFNSQHFLLEIIPQKSSPRTRFLHVLSLGKLGQAEPTMRSALVAKGDQLVLTISNPDRTFHLELPPLDSGAGRIALTPSDGKPLRAYRPFSSGVLPHDPEGIRLMEQWDADYRGKNPPIWDIGKAAKELRDVVDGGKVRPCRALDLCCGTGTDAIFLARQGFDVTAIDISPTALAQAQKKAQTAGAAVRWLLADVLAAPILEPFDFIYDRGCYHVVRDQNLTAYLETVGRLSHPGSQFLLLAARSDVETAGGGPTGVAEQELRFDFLSLFDIEWLRETRLEANRPGGIGPPAWAALLLRKTESKPEPQ